MGEIERAYRIEREENKKVNKIEIVAIEVGTMIVACLILLLCLPLVIIYPIGKKLKYHRFKSVKAGRIVQNCISKVWRG